MNENVKVFIIASLVIVFLLVLPSLVESAKLLSPESGFADEKAVEEILDDKSNNQSDPLLEDSEGKNQYESLDQDQNIEEDIMPADEFDTIIKTDDDN